MIADVNPDLLAFLKEEEVRSRNEELLQRAETNLHSYKGDYYGDEVDGRSKAVARDVAEVVDHMGISVLRTFVSGDRVVEFEPLSSADEQAADDATEVMRRDFQRKGYKLLHDWFKEGNISVLGIVKACVETKKKKVEQVIPEELLPLVPGEVISKKKAEDHPQFGKMVNVTAIVDSPPEFVDRLVPLEEFRFSPDACTLDEAAYLAHATVKTISDLVEMGFDPEDVETAYDFTQTDTSLAQARSSLNYFDYGQDRQGALRQVILMEEYVRFDLDEDGIAERLCVHRVGDTLLRVEEVDYQPFVIYCPFPMPGRIDGESLAEKVTDIQRINTALLRLGLDGLYCNLAPGYLVPDSAVNENTYDDLLTVRPNRIVRYSGAVPPTPELKNDVSQTAFNAIEFMIGQRESRTGVTRLNQGLDADTLNKTATGTALMQAQGQQMEEYLARNFAEAVATLMALKLTLYRRYSPPVQLRVDGQYRQIMPAQWPDEMDIMIRVGLGTGRKEQRLQNRMMLLQIQREAMLGGLPIVGPEQIYKSMAGVVRDASLGSPSDFVIDPSTIPPQPPQPSPEEQELQAKMQLEAAKLQGEQQLAEARLQMDMAEAERKAELEQAKAASSAELARITAELAHELAVEKAEADRQLAFSKAGLDHDRATFDASLAQRKFEHDAQMAEEKAILDANLAQDKASLDANLAMNKADQEAAIKARDNATRMELDAQEAAAQAELDRAKAEEDAQLARDKAEEEAKLAREKAEFEARLALEKQEFEEDMALRQQRVNEELAERDANRADHDAQRNADRKDYETENKVKNNRPGGDLSE